MSIVEKAGANVLKTNFSKKGKKKKEKGKSAERTELDIAKEPETVAVDYKALSANGFFDPADKSSQLALELRAVKRRLLRRIGYLRASGERQAFRTSGKQRNIILVTSTRAGEGKTFTASNLALSLALEDNIETLLIDGDLARPKVRERFGLPAAPGLADCMLDKNLDPETLGWRLKNTTMRILSEGARTERPTDLFNTADSQRFWNDLATADPSRLIIVDAPPVLATTEAVILAKYANEILFVVEANSTPESAVAAAIDELIDVNPNVSIMLNRCQIGAGGAHYGAYEYYGRESGDENPEAEQASTKD
ncbi:hypothetical protein PUV54_02235 [Hyphococcus flavus]|uniref:Uncharacterized protein n=1 Tax=Hyphococcus flavus TaxID=1866326 RepID=A0AAF0CHK1_9PROT|nr:hypothetical protein [Hyphococcus flavus]WDI32007.1 hypothetical protein PUV54_02235 [Hyphococcus flavus]